MRGWIHTVELLALGHPGEERKSVLAEFWRAMPITRRKLAETTMTEPIRRRLQRPLVPPRPPVRLRQPSAITHRPPLSPLLPRNDQPKIAIGRPLHHARSPGQYAIDGEENAPRPPPNPYM
jgi:hypothetical protein